MKKTKKERIALEKKREAAQRYRKERKKRENMWMERQRKEAARRRGRTRRRAYGYYCLPSLIEWDNSKGTTRLVFGNVLDPRFETVVVKQSNDKDWKLLGFLVGMVQHSFDEQRATVILKRAFSKYQHSSKEYLQGVVEYDLSQLLEDEMDYVLKVVKRRNKQNNRRHYIERVHHTMIVREI